VAAHDAAVLTVARITAGTTTNVIPETAHLEGTMRTLDEDVRTRLREVVRRVCHHTALAHGCAAEVDIEPGYPVTVNDDDAADRASGVGREVLGAARVATMPTPIMGAEDFSYVLQRVPGALAFLGGCPDGTDPATAPPNHSNRVRFDEQAMASGVAVYAGLALDALSS
jgi:hippurate hydrolase